MDATLTAILRTLLEYSQTIDALRARVAELEAELRKRLNAEEAT